MVPTNKSYEGHRLNSSRLVRRVPSIGMGSSWGAYRANRPGSLSLIAAQKMAAAPIQKELVSLHARFFGPGAPKNSLDVRSLSRPRREMLFSKFGRAIFDARRRLEALRTVNQKRYGTDLFAIVAGRVKGNSTASQRDWIGQVRILRAMIEDFLPIRNRLRPKR